MIHARFSSVLAVLSGVLAAYAVATPPADAACGPTYCPSYGTSLHSCPWRSGIRCRVDPVKKDNPSFTELSSIFDQIAAGPAKYGSLGWNYSLELTDGNNKPKAPSKVPAHYPCGLLKAVSAHESVGWNQFCIPTGPDCPGYQRTIVACDCGYGLMQVTSGMDQAHAMPSYDVNRVASDSGYNASVGSQIYGGKWSYGPSVGDRRVDVIEDWYFATWGYNGFAYSNNPNNPAYPADRKQYRDPGGLSAGNYPYQEKIWGYVRVPYGAKEGKGAGYKAYAISLPNRAEICSSCGKPTADISDPSPLHVSDCPGDGGPVTPPGPRYELSTKIQGGVDPVADGSSKGIADLLENDTWTVDLVIKNAGDQVSPNLDLGVWIEEPFVKALTWKIESNATSPDFAVNDADGRTDQPPRTSPGQAFTFHMNAFGVGETKRVRLEVRGAQYSLGLADHPDVRFWVKNVEGVYAKPDFDSKPTNPSGQTFNGGDLRAWAQVDIFSPTKWTFDGGTLEGWSGAAGANVTVDAAAKAMVVEATGDDPQAIGPATAFDAAALPTLKMRARSTLGGPVKIYFATKAQNGFDEARALEIQSPGAELGDVQVDMSKHPAWQGTITRLRIDPAPSGKGTFVAEDLRMAGPGGFEPGGSDAGTTGNAGNSGDLEGGCGCRLVPAAGSSSGLALVGLLALGLRRRRR
ncbi:MAG: hypothetical protein HYV09_34795 [Deltaproteobacteria bacterium]|nr:hypothetical protein [Deltaproteobacteria bacterium]